MKQHLDWHRSRDLHGRAQNMFTEFRELSGLKWRASCEHLKHEDSEGPPIDRRVVPESIKLSHLMLLDQRMGHLRPRIISGAMYVGEPQKVLVLVCPSGSTFASAQSASNKLPLIESRMLDGFRSLWITCIPCKCRKPCTNSAVYTLTVAAERLRACITLLRHRQPAQQHTPV